MVPAPNGLQIPKNVSSRAQMDLSLVQTAARTWCCPIDQLAQISIEHPNDPAGVGCLQLPRNPSQ